MAGELYRYRKNKIMNKEKSIEIWAIGIISIIFGCVMSVRNVPSIFYILKDFPEIGKMRKKLLPQV